MNQDEFHKYRTQIERRWFRRRKNGRRQDETSLPYAFYRDWMAWLQLIGLLILGFCLFGCESMDHLVNGVNRQNTYDNSAPPIPLFHKEPYATFAGYHLQDNGEINVYIVHWHHNSLDNKCLLESEIDELKIPKYFI